MVGYIYKELDELEIFRRIKRWIRPIVSGLMMTVILSFVYRSRRLGKFSHVKLIGVSVIMSLILCNAIYYADLFRSKTGMPAKPL